MFGVSFLELLVVLVVALLVFGPDKLPEIAKTLGKVSGELKRNADALRREFYNNIYPPPEEIKQRIDFQQRQLVSTDTTKSETPPNDQNREESENAGHTTTEQPDSGAEKPTH